MLETTVKSLWSRVPATSKADIGKVGERLISLLRDRLVSIIGQPACAGDYRDPLQRIVEDAYERMWRDPKLQLVNRTIRDMFQRAGGEQLAAALLPIALPRLRTAAFEMMLPSWQAMHDLVVEGRSEEHTSELQSLMRISYAVFCLKKKKT